MFDVGFSELLVIGIVALVVIGPEKLPRVARTVGALLGRMQRYVNDVKADINREIELDELKKLQTTVQDAATSIQTSMNETVSGFQSQADELNKIASGDIAGLTETKPADAAATSAEAAAVVASSPDASALTAVDTAAGISEVAAAESISHQGSQGMLPLEPAPTNTPGLAASENSAAFAAAPEADAASAGFVSVNPAISPDAILFNSSACD